MQRKLLMQSFESEKVPLLHAEVAALKGNLFGMQKTHSICAKKHVLMTKLLKYANMTKRQIGGLQVQLSVLKKEEKVVNNNPSPFFNSALQEAHSNLQEARDEHNSA